jgi:hypothetical protein
VAKFSVADWLPVILADFAGTPVADFDVRLIDFDPVRPGDLVALVPDIQTWAIPSDPTAHRLLLKVVMTAPDWFPEGLVPTNLKTLDWGDPEELAVEIASTLQDHVMDNLNTTWPEVAGDGRTVVLEPRLGPDGMPRWEGRGVEPCRFGRLSDRLA